MTKTELPYGAIELKDFGAVGYSAGENHSLQTDDTSAIQSALNSGYTKIYATSQRYKITSQLNIPDGVELIGLSSARVDKNYEIFAGTIFVLSGNATKGQTIDGDITDNSPCGGVIANPSTGQSYLSTSETRGNYYRLTDFTNRNASRAI